MHLPQSHGVNISLISPFLWETCSDVTRLTLNIASAAIMHAHTHALLSLSLSWPLAAPVMRPDSLLRLRHYINPLLTYLLTYLHLYTQVRWSLVLFLVTLHLLMTCIECLLRLAMTTATSALQWVNNWRQASHVKRCRFTVVINWSLSTLFTFHVTLGCISEIRSL